MSSGSAIFRIVRNPAGIITQYIIKSPDLASYGIDSLVTNVTYNTSLGRYTYTRFDLSLSGISISDSTILSYDATGNISGKTDYIKSIVGGYTPSGRVDYTYAAGNIASEKSYDYNGTAYTLSSSTTYTYDTKVNPLKLGVEAILIGMSTSFGPNNSTALNYIDAIDPTGNYSIVSTLAYNTTNKPSGGTAVENPGATNYTLRFYYN